MDRAGLELELATESEVIRAIARRGGHMSAAWAATDLARRGDDVYRRGGLLQRRDQSWLEHAYRQPERGGAEEVIRAVSIGVIYICGMDCTCSGSRWWKKA